MKFNTPKYLKTILLLITALTSVGAHALRLDTYTPSSVFAEGKWVKISVPESGVYKITKAQLQKWGFSDISKVRVYGYGGNRIPDRLSAENYIDDAPMVQTAIDGDGIVFYGVGPEKWKETSGCQVPEYNIYTRHGYYFVSDRSAPDAPAIEKHGRGIVDNPATYFMDRRHYELDQTSPGEAGYVLVGENLKHRSDLKIQFDTPGWVEGIEATLQGALVAKTFSATSIDYYVNDTKLPEISSDMLLTINNTPYLHASYNVSTHKFDKGAEKTTVKVNVRNPGVTQNVWLDYVTLNYPRRLQLPSQGHLSFWSTNPQLKLAATSPTDVVVWDVTDPQQIFVLNANAVSDGVQWGNDFNGMRSYAAWRRGATLPQPIYVSTVSNHNIHSLTAPEMVIFTLPELRDQARRIADIHLADSMTVEVLSVQDVYDEFASGVADVSALRKCLKMFYDRSKNSDKPLRYALIMGRATYDNRHLTSQFSGAGAYNTVPYWMGGTPSTQFSDNTGFGTDDFIAMLEDGSGLNMGIDNLCVAVGRIPATSASEAKSYIDKLQRYLSDKNPGTWKNSFLFLADDGDEGIHVNDTERMIKEFIGVEGQQAFINKVYVDAYEIIGGVCEGGRSDMYRLLNEGAVWWNYCGHANNHSWTAEGMLTFTDINNMYLKNIPIVMAATCDFLRWDSNTISGGEIMFHEPNGGAIAMISATRPVYISDNAMFTRAMGRAIQARDSEGRIQRLGDIYRNAKNDITDDSGEHRSNPNRLRYVLMGDPAMAIPTPSNLVRLDAIDGVPVNPDTQVTLKALQQAELTGTVLYPDGSPITDFNGTLQVNIYDAERSTTTKGVRKENVKVTFEQHGDKLFAGTAKVTDGHFTLKVSMPSEVADNFRPATINMFAISDEGTTQAVGVNSDFYVYGFDDSTPADNEPPVIESMVLNHESFVNGGEVNASPMLIANISDNVGINLSAAGIGHQMTVILDGKRTLNDVSLYYTPATDGSPSGEIRYTLNDLSDGNHTLTLRIWDTASNSTTRDIDFFVNSSMAPTLFDVYTDVNPASTEVKFYIRHNRPDALLSATFTVYDLLGHPLWTTTSKGPSDMFITAPVSWDLTDSSGRRLPRGIYLYRAVITSDNGDSYDSATRRLAITAN